MKPAEEREKISRLPFSVLDLNASEFEYDLKIIEGRLSEDLRGHVFIVGPNFDYETGSKNNKPKKLNKRTIYNGDGIVYRIDFLANQADGNSTKASIKSRTLKPPCYYADLATQNDKYYGHRFSDAGAAGSGALGARNQLNTALFVKGDQLYATFDAGRAYEIDPDRLEVKQPLGSGKDWESFLPAPIADSSIFPPYQTPAHPAVSYPTFSPNAKLYTANYSAGLERILGFLRENMPKCLKEELGAFTKIMHWDANGKLQKWSLVSKDGSPVIFEQTLHQMAITENHLILCDTAFVMEFSQIAWPLVSHFFPQEIGEWLFTNKFVEFIQSTILTRLRLQLPYANFYIVKLKDLENSTQPEAKVFAKKVTIPREVSHYVVDYEEEKDEKGRIKLILHTAHNNAWDVSECIKEWDQPAFSEVSTIRKELAGMVVGPMDVSFLGRYEIDLEKGIILDSKIICDPECTWAVSLYSHPNTSKIKSLCWLAWGYRKELIPRRIFNAYKRYLQRGVSTDNFIGPKSNFKDKPVTLLKLNTTTMKTEKYEFPYHCFVSSIQFVPKFRDDDNWKVGEEGYIVCVVYSDSPNNENESTGDEIWIFDTENIKAPVCKLAHPKLDIGLTIHTAWMHQLPKNRESFEETVEARKKSFDDDYQSKIEKLIQRQEKVSALRIRKGAYYLKKAVPLMPWIKKTFNQEELESFNQIEKPERLTQDFFDDIREKFSQQQPIDSND